MSQTNRFPWMFRSGMFCDRTPFAPTALRMLGGMMVAIAVLGTGCSAPDTTTTVEPPEPAVVSPAPTRADSDLGQQLPITAVTMLGGQDIFLEVAVTPEQQALGLMYREALPDDRGMLFPMGRPRPVSFWMKNVPVPLDMVFIYQGTIQAIAAEAAPCATEPCPSYGPGNQPIDQVIELRGGRAAELGLEVGDRVEIMPLEP
jgi:uncharacterized protein